MGGGNTPSPTPDVDYVDLGLPSGLLWSKYNLGSNLVEGPGFYYSWGNTDGHYLGDGYVFSMSNYADTEGYLVTGALTADNDAATVLLGRPWRTPTTDEYSELFANCDLADDTIGSNLVVKLRSRINGVILILPRAGYVRADGRVNFNEHFIAWCSNSSYGNSAYSVRVDLSLLSTFFQASRYTGRPIRPVISASDLSLL